MDFQWYYGTSAREFHGCDYCCPHLSRCGQYSAHWTRRRINDDHLWQVRGALTKHTWLAVQHNQAYLILSGWVPLPISMVVESQVRSANLILLLVLNSHLYNAWKSDCIHSHAYAILELCVSRLWGRMDFSPFPSSFIIHASISKSMFQIFSESSANVSESTEVIAGLFTIYKSNLDAIMLPELNCVIELECFWWKCGSHHSLDVCETGALRAIYR